eukprot:1159576-Pelagomonas_calceolata.AAC.8
MMHAGQKGSDYSAKEATRKVICGAKQLEALQSMISLVMAEANAHHVEVRVELAGSAVAPWQGGVVTG